MKFKNLGQVSIFLIIALVVLILGLFYIFLADVEFWTPFDSPKDQISDVVKNCVQVSGERAVFLLGFQGGYIDVPLSLRNNFQRISNFGMKIPNWDTDFNDIPTISFMENQIDNFVINDSFSCIKNGLDALGENLEINYSSNMLVKSQILDEKINLDIDFLINFREKNSKDETSIGDFFVEVQEVRLGKLYDLAVEIYNLEGQTYFLENLILEQIYSANDYTSSLSMPNEGMFFSCGKRIWTKTQLKQNLANLNNNNFKYLQFEGTFSKDYIFEANLNGQFDSEGFIDYYQSSNIGYVQKLQNYDNYFKNFEVDLFTLSSVGGSNNIFNSVPFSYRKFEVTPSSGELVKSMDYKVDAPIGKIPIPCIQLFHHLYELDYDIMVKLTDKNDDAQNFFFQFPLRVKIKNNFPLNRGFTSIIPDRVETDFNSLNFCEEDNKKYPLKVVALDYNTEDPIKDVNISYDCMGLTCDIGKTKKFSYKGYEYGSSAFLEGNFPFCVGGNVIANKEGYHFGKVRVEETSEEVFTDKDKGYVEVKIMPVISFDVNKRTFMGIEMETGKGNVVNGDLDSNTGFMFLNLENEEYEFYQDIMWPAEEGFFDKIDFLNVEGISYNISMIYVDKDFQLRGMLELENWIPDLNEMVSGRELRVIIPSSSSEILPEEYEEFYNYASEIANSEYSNYDYGISFK